MAVSSSAAAPKEPSLLNEDGDVFRWRAEQFRQLGFDEAQAGELAASTADLGQARYLLGSGCPPHLALAILL
jgi:alpha-tubulin suppressor-like RCC1 family protein